MHEVSLANSLVELIEEQAKSQNFSQVKEISVEIGQLSHVDPQAFIQAFASAKTALMEDSKLIILEPEGLAYCFNCTKQVTIKKRGEPCPDCQSYQLFVEEGTELKLKSLEVI
ncbi:MAG: hydrogenase maturation nickel metallochaperone HypA [Alphaproteobacteria bacterium]